MYVILGISNLRITFLGTGTSSGIPVVGCDCATCCSEDPRDRRWKFGGNVVESLRFGGAGNVHGINCTKTEADSS